MIDTKEIREIYNLKIGFDLSDLAEVNISCKIINDLCHAYDEQQRRIASLKIIAKDHKKLMCASHMGQIAREKLADENIKLRKTLKDLLDFAEDEIQGNFEFCSEKYKQVILNAMEILKKVTVTED